MLEILLVSQATTTAVAQEFDLITHTKAIVAQVTLLITMLLLLDVALCYILSNSNQVLCIRKNSIISNTTSHL